MAKNRQNWCLGGWVAHDRHGLQSIGGSPLMLILPKAILLLFAVPQALHPSEAESLNRSAFAHPCPPAPGSRGPAGNVLSNNNAQKKPASPPACLEIKAEPATIVEFLKFSAQSEKWRLEQSTASESGWIFVRHLDREELARFAHTEILAGRIVWSEGTVAVHVTTSEASDGFTRVQISAKFQGRGETKLPLARPWDLWPLASRGTLEDGMIAALEGHFGSSPQLKP